MNAHARVVMAKEKRDELSAPFVGGNKWGPRVMLASMACVIVAVAGTYGEWRYLMLVPFLAVGATAFELAMVINARTRQWIFLNGEQVEARVIRKADIRGMNRVLAAYKFQGAAYESWSSVSDKTFAHLRVGAVFTIRVHPQIPTRWLPAS